MTTRLVPEIGWRRAGPDGVRLDARLIPLLRELVELNKAKQ